MNTAELRKYLGQLPVTHSGVYASDQLPTYITPSTAIVVNTVPHTESGEHWVAIYLDLHSNVIEYFDSYGRAPYVPEFVQFLRRNSRYKYIYNKYNLQGYDTSVCGLYCLTFLYCRIHMDMSMNDFLQQFDYSTAATSSSSSSVVNDVLVQKIFKEVFLPIT